jgi:hypothetical protein
MSLLRAAVYAKPLYRGLDSVRYSYPMYLDRPNYVIAPITFSAYIKAIHFLDVTIGLVHTTKKRRFLNTVENNGKWWPIVLK